MDSKLLQVMFENYQANKMQDKNEAMEKQDFQNELDSVNGYYYERYLQQRVAQFSQGSESLGIIASSAAEQIQKVTSELLQMIADGARLSAMTEKAMMLNRATTNLVDVIKSMHCDICSLNNNCRLNPTCTLGNFFPKIEIIGEV